MTVKLSIENDVSPLKTIGGMLLVCAVLFVCFVLLSVLFFILIHLAEHGGGSASVDALMLAAGKLVKDPGFFWEIYQQWWQALVSGVKSLRPDPLLFLPLAAPLLSVVLLWLLWLKSSYSLSLWYIFNHHFANASDVEKMGLLNGFLMVLGRFQGKVLGLCRPASVLCFGEAGCGKTSTVAIPSVLRSDSACVVAVDNSSTLARHTSGYRAKLGKVFYFNWDLCDDDAKGVVYPRWNPLSVGNLPPKGVKRDEYLGFVASYLTAEEKRENKRNYWEMLAYNTIYSMLQFMVSKVSQAEANDYFLNKILENGRLGKEDKDVLLSYYVLMPEKYAEKAVKEIHREKISAAEYFPVGSWAGIPSSWQGKELCLGMVTDWFVQHYLASHDDGMHGDWLNWLESLKAEAVLFNYHPAAVEGIERFLSLSRQQREIIFAFVLKPFKIFVNQAVRERTSGNDFCLGQLRGIRNAETREFEPVTVYSTANTKSSKFISRMFVEMLLRHNLEPHKHKGPFPVLTVIDDVGQMLKIRGLAESVAKGPQMKMSFLMLCNSLHNMENTYSKTALEDLVVNTSYKIIMAEDTVKLSRQLNKLAVFASRSVQIPADKKPCRFRHKIFADSNYYHHLAKELRARKNLKVITKGYQILLAEGYYHRPVLTKHVHFLKDEKFRGKAVVPANYFLSGEAAARRNVQDLRVPAIDEVLFGMDLGIDDETELNQYMDMVYDEMKNKAPENALQAEEKNGADWWMQESAFEAKTQGRVSNPFEKK